MITSTIISKERAALTLSSTAVTYTLIDAWTVTGNLTISLSTTVNGFSFTTGGNLTAANSVSGTTTYTMNGTGTLAASAGIPSLTINTAGTITLANGIIDIKTSLTITAVGTLNAGTSTLRFPSAATSFTDSVGVVFYNVQTSVTTVTVTLNSNLRCSNNFGGGTTGVWNGAFTIYCVNYTYGANGISGSATVEMNGGGALNLAGILSGTGGNSMNLVFNSGANTITCSTTIQKSGGTITYTSGTMVMTSSTLSVTGNITLNTNGMSWNNVSPTGNITLTINSLLTVTGTWTTNNTTTFAGTSGWNITTWVCSTAGIFVTFKNGVTYTSSGSVSMQGTSASHMSFQSDDAVLRAIWTVPNNGTTTQTMVYINGTRIDSSLGQTIWSFGGTLTSTLNWGATGQLYTVSQPFV